MKDMTLFDGTFFAHRGLHDNKTIPENSLSAFQLAVDHGYGIEFDVYLTDDGSLVVHHDFTLNRTCGMDEEIEKINSKHLEQYKLMGTQHSIPLFSDLLKIVNGKVPLILEIKATHKVNDTCSAIYEMIKDYNGPIAIESFATKIVNWWVRNHNEYPIGQLYADSKIINTILKLMLQYKKVDFLAPSKKQMKTKYIQRIRRRYPEKRIVNWTVRTTSDLLNAYNLADNFIFECNMKNDGYLSLIDLDNIRNYAK